MDVLIENYRGFDIMFDKDNEKFTFSTDDIKWNEKQTYKACKTKIDEYLKENSGFKPFQIRNADTILEVVGARKDGKFVIEKGGKKEILSEYAESSWFIVNDATNEALNSIAAKNKQREELGKEISLIMDEIKFYSVKVFRKERGV